MGSNNNQRQPPPTSGTAVPGSPMRWNPNYGPNPGKSGSDPRGRIQNQGNYQQQRYEQQQGPMLDFANENYRRGTETGFRDYENIMDQYQQMAGPGGAYAEFAKTGGYSPEDMANIRARGISPMRTAYANAQRELQRQRGLQGGYSPNAIAAQVKMAREQGQGMADASTNVEAMLAEMRNKSRLAGLAGQADALRGMGSLYGTSPGMAEAFGQQAINLLGQGGDFGLGLMRNEIAGQQLPGRFDTWMDRIGQVADIGSTIAYPWLNDERQQQIRPEVMPRQGINPALGPMAQQQIPLPPQNRRSVSPPFVSPYE